MGAFGKEYHLWILAESVGQWHTKWKAVSAGVFKRKCYGVVIMGITWWITN